MTKPSHVFIAPTIGRIVWYYESRHTDPRAAMIAAANTDSSVNLGVLAWSGAHYTAYRVPLVQDGEERPENGHFCEWMPFQKGQAAKTEKLEEWKRETEALGLVVHHDEPLCDGPKAHDPFRGA